MKDTIDLTLERVFSKDDSSIQARVSEMLASTSGRWGLKKGYEIRRKFPWQVCDKSREISDESFFMTGTKLDRKKRRYVESFCEVDGSCDCCGKVEKKLWVVNSSLCNECEERIKNRDRNIFERYESFV